MKNVLLTGAKGKLGSAIMDVLKYKTYYDGSYVGTSNVYNVYGIDIDQYDLMNDFDIERLFDYIQRNLNPLDVVINNAAIDNPPGDSTNFMTNIEEIIKVNLIASAKIAHKAALMMKNNINGGVIINIGSILGNVAADYRNYKGDFEKPVGYNLSKAGLIQLSRSLAVQYGAWNIRSVCVAFGAVDTGKLDEEFMSKFVKNIPLKRFVSIDSVVKSIEYAIDCPELTGQQILIDGGYTAW